MGGADVTVRSQNSTKTLNAHSFKYTPAAFRTDARTFSCLIGLTSEDDLDGVRKGDCLPFHMPVSAASGTIPGWQLTCISSLDDGECSRKLWSSRVLPSKAERNDVFSSTAESKKVVFEEVSVRLIPSFQGRSYLGIVLWTLPAGLGNR